MGRGGESLAVPGKDKVRTGPSLAAGFRRAEGGLAALGSDPGGGAALVVLGLCFALKAPPFGLRRATLWPRPTNSKSQKTRTKYKNKRKNKRQE